MYIELNFVLHLKLLLLVFVMLPGHCYSFHCLYLPQQRMTTRVVNMKQQRAYYILFIFNKVFLLS